MYDSGYMRWIDDLGRIVLPFDVRNSMDIGSEEAFQIFTDPDEDSIILKRCSDPSTAEMPVILAIKLRENILFNKCGGRLLEGTEELNNLQREKIAAVYRINGCAFVGSINCYGAERDALTTETVFAAYAGQKIHNFGVDFVVPRVDTTLAEMIVQWNAKELPLSLGLIRRITNRIESVGGMSLMWS